MKEEERARKRRFRLSSSEEEVEWAKGFSFSLSVCERLDEVMAPIIVLSPDSWLRECALRMYF